MRPGLWVFVIAREAAAFHLRTPSLFRPTSEVAAEVTPSPSGPQRSIRSTTDELASLSLPDSPHPDLGPGEVALAVCRGLQHGNVPREDAGLARAFAFITWECRKAVTARQGADTIERFVEYGSRSPVLLPLMNAVAVDVHVNDITITAGTQTRGAMASVRVDAFGAKLEEGYSDDAALIPTTFAVQLQQERRPPLSGCWLIRDVVDVRYAFAGDSGVDTSE